MPEAVQTLVLPSAMEALEQMWFIVAFWNATWALLQIGNPHADVDYTRMVENTFAGMAQRL